MSVESCPVPRRSHPALLALVLAAALSSACDTPGGVAAGVATAATLLGARSPSQSIEQTYYVGIFDPLEQLPPAVYRMTVRGQASAISRTRFASGWVPASLVDGLGSHIGFDQAGKVTLEDSEKTTGAIVPGRHLMLFGPEGFREAPKDHRLAIVMGSSPQEFFNAIQDSLAAVVHVQQEALESNESQHILEELYRLLQERQELAELDLRLTRSEESIEEAR